jgi:hypothetical protein
LLDITNGSSEYAIKTLRGLAGVVFADRLEGNPDVIAMVQAPTRKRLAEALMPIIGGVNTITEDFRLLVTQDKKNPVGILSLEDRPRQRLVRKTGISP